MSKQDLLTVLLSCLPTSVLANSDTLNNLLEYFLLILVILIVTILSPYVV